MEVGGAQPKRRTFKKFSFRGVDLDQLLDMGTDELVNLFHARARRRPGSVPFFLDCLVFCGCLIGVLVLFLVGLSAG